MKRTPLFRPRLVPSLAVTLALSLAGLAAPAAADAFLERGAGSWSGTGWALPEGRDKPEPLRCRVTGRYEAPRLTLEGRCLGAGFSRPVAGWIEPDGDRYRGLGRFAVRGQETVIPAVRDGDTLRFQWSERQKDGTLVPLYSEITLDGEMTMGGGTREPDTPRAEVHLTR